MQPLPRLKWAKGGRGFKAYPAGDHYDSHNQRYAEIWLQVRGVDTDQTPPRYRESWAWVVRWDGWFSEHGFVEGKQAAADKATERWWSAVQTEVPRNIELEIAMIVARAPVRPIPNSLLGEESEFLRKVLWHLDDVYQATTKPEAAPAQVNDVVSRLSEELYRRRLAEPEPEKPALVISGGYRRRRRR